MTSDPNFEALSGDTLLDLFASAAVMLRAAAGRIDAINVYPVPDGDTGSNMAATLEEAVGRARAAAGSGGAGDVLMALARGALYGARGNSGVILSQALRGMASEATSGTLDGAALARALETGSTAAYSAVSKPVEGTMLTVLRAAAAGARQAADAGGNVLSTLSAAVAGAETAEALTPTQLPSLAEAGVTDSGGEGVCVILRGLLAGIDGETRDVTPRHTISAPIASLAGHASDEFGFCTEFLIEAELAELDLEAVRHLVEAGPNHSVVVVGDATLARVHVHTDHPEALISAASSFGRVSRVKIEDMDAQRERFGQTGSGAGTKLAVLALAPGPGFQAIFAGLGARTLPLGAVAKPSAGDLAAAADGLRLADVILLPNHSNVLMAAEQAVALARCTLHVVPSRSAPEGIAAALAFDAARSAAENVETMVAAVASVQTVEVTQAAADRTADGVTMSAGDDIALLDGRLVAAACSPLDALLAGLAKAEVAAANLITVYAGAGISSAELVEARAAVLERFRVEVEGLSGGQDLYTFIASIER